MSEPTTTTITCAACGRAIRTVSVAVAEAFGSGSWLCADPDCYRARQVAAAATSGRLL